MYLNKPYYEHLYKSVLTYKLLPPTIVGGKEIGAEGVNQKEDNAGKMTIKRESHLL